ncbi:MAG: SpoIID/LytB domain-containing protein [Candidatus Neomarinimicrobiota bacterium]|jgi:SpoIID/LytB domain protein|nr:SpoIID/LytB domain-containing protein [Candidatus Neomarinimicrobiota bacterium]MDD3965606.1 SpoIID/LytB domain-containing protein [Candidatus Neomarinimicrobiota bacterium]MDX9779412.1 SpoIID/LytB domain-containing protein [bacterium]
MLKPGFIPQQEPSIRVGIVLPQDKQKKISAFLSNMCDYEMAVDTLTFSTCEVSSILFTVEERGILFQIDEKQYERVRKVILRPTKETAHLTIDPVISGREFHWRKHISVRLPGTIEITIQEKHLLVINELPLEKYLMCVATSEMGAACPSALIEAQTVVARSWMLANVEQKHTALGIDVCNDDCCQRYQGLNNVTDISIKGANSTRGKVILYDGKICDARYSKSCGGKMETFENLWEDTPLAYMQNLPDMPEGNRVPDLTVEKNARAWIMSTPKEAFCSSHTVPEDKLKQYIGACDDEGEYFRWTVEISNDTLSANLREKLGLDVKAVLELQTRKRAGSGRLLELGIVYLNFEDKKLETVVHKDYNARLVLHPKFLFSSAVIIENIGCGKVPRRFVYHGAGWGHGAGMCQIGALGMSLKGYTTEEILAHYYPGSIYKQIYK